MQCIVWNTWGPIESGAQYAFDWSESTVAMFANWGTIMFLLAVVPLSKMVEVRERIIRKLFWYQNKFRKGAYLPNPLIKLLCKKYLCKTFTQAYFSTSGHFNYPQ